MKRLITTTLLFILSILPSLSKVSAIEVELTIEGKGTISAIDSAIDCAESCIISNTLDSDKLLPTAEEGEHFKGWSGQKCDEGEEIVVGTSFHEFSQANGGAKTLASADIDGDGLVDLAQISLFDGRVKLLHNQGNGEFNPVTLAETALNYPSALAFYDWDNDSDQDLLVTEFERNQIKLYKNNGSGQFQFEKNITIPNVKPYSIAVEDIDNDNVPDLAISSFSADTSGDLFALVASIQNIDTSWYTNDGNDQFSHYAHLSDKAAITLDVSKSNDVGIVSLVAAEIMKGSISIYQLSNGDVLQKTIDTSSAPYGTTFGDIDNDGILDVLSAFYRPSKAKVVFGLGNNEYSEPVELKVFSEGVTGTAIVDMNNDGFKDVVLGEFNKYKFGFIPTLSYKGCKINTSAKIELTAMFSGDETVSTPAPTTPPSVNQPANKSSGGGSNSLLFSIFIACALLFRILKKG